MAIGDEIVPEAGCLRVTIHHTQSALIGCASTASSVP